MLLKSLIQKINSLLTLTQSKVHEDVDIALSVLASQSGLPVDTIFQLKRKIEVESHCLPLTIEGGSLAN